MDSFGVCSSGLVGAASFVCLLLLFVSCVGWLLIWLRFGFDVWCVGSGWVCVLVILGLGVVCWYWCGWCVCYGALLLLLWVL